MSNETAYPILLGSTVIVDLIDTTGEAERYEFIIVAEKDADFKAGLLGEKTPLARALLGRFTGETIPYKVGDLVEVRILAGIKLSAPINGKAAEKRRAIVQEAVNQSEIINQLIFATARGSKWGEYDVDVDKLLSRSEDNEDKPNDDHSRVT